MSISSVTPFNAFPEASGDSDANAIVNLGNQSTVSTTSPVGNIEELVKQSRVPASQPTQKLALNAEGKATVPLIDLKEIERATGTARGDLIEKFGNSLKEYGFIAVKAGELIELVKQVNEQSEKYFHQPKEFKLEDWRDNYGQELLATRSGNSSRC